MKTLLGIAHKNRTVICTVHQPRSDIFQLFDSVLLLSKGNYIYVYTKANPCFFFKGRQVYFGPAKDMISYFESIGHVCPEHMNPADYFCMRNLPLPLPPPPKHCLTLFVVVSVVDLITVDVRTQVDEKESRGRLEGLVAAFDKSSHCGAIEQDLMGEMMGEEGPEEGESNHSPRKAKRSPYWGRRKSKKRRKGQERT